MMLSKRRGDGKGPVGRLGPRVLGVGREAELGADVRL